MEAQVPSSFMFREQFNAKNGTRYVVKNFINEATGEIRTAIYLQPPKIKIPNLPKTPEEHSPYWLDHEDNINEYRYYHGFDIKSTKRRPPKKYRRRLSPSSLRRQGFIEFSRKFHNQIVEIKCLKIMENLVKALKKEEISKKDWLKEQAPPSPPSDEIFSEKTRGRKHARPYSKDALLRSAPAAAKAVKDSRVDYEEEDIIVFKGRGARRMTM